MYMGKRDRSGSPKAKAGSPKAKASPPKKAVRVVNIGALVANSFENQCERTAKKLQLLVDKGLLRPGPAALCVKYKGEERTASLSDDLRITLDDEQSTPIQSINQLRSMAFPSSTTAPWMAVYHAGFSLQQLQQVVDSSQGYLASAASIEHGTDDAVDEYPEDEETPLEEEWDVSLRVTDPVLAPPDSAYKRTVAAARTRELNALGIDVIHAALRDVITSSDPLKAEALSDLLECGIPVQVAEPGVDGRAPPGKEPLLVLAARQHEKPAHFETLVALALANASFEAKNSDGETAAEMLNAQQPQMVQRIIKRALEIRSGAAAE